MISDKAKELVTSFGYASHWAVKSEDRVTSRAALVDYIATLEEAAVTDAIAMRARLDAALKFINQCDAIVVSTIEGATLHHASDALFDFVLKHAKTALGGVVFTEAPGWFAPDDEYKALEVERDAANARARALATGLRQAALDLGNCAAAVMLGTPLPVEFMQRMDAQARAVLEAAHVPTEAKDKSPEGALADFQRRVIKEFAFDCPAHDLTGFDPACAACLAKNENNSGLAILMVLAVHLKGLK